MLSSVDEPSVQDASRGDQTHQYFDLAPPYVPLPRLLGLLHLALPDVRVLARLLPSCLAHLLGCRRRWERARDDVGAVREEDRAVRPGG